MDSFIDSHDATLTMQRKVNPYSHPESFSQFFSDWILFLQIHVFPNYVVRFDDRRVNEGATLRAFGEASESIWPNITTLALIELVQQRYIRTHVLGDTRDEDTEFVQNKVRWATDYLRTVLGVSPNTVIARDEPRSFESGLPADLSSNPFALHHQRVSAVVTLLYQIRCNLFHGVKGFRNGSRRDELLTTLGVEVIRDVVAALVAQNNADTLPEI
jgi:hypothetical protein